MENSTVQKSYYRLFHQYGTDEALVRTNLTLLDLKHRVLFIQGRAEEVLQPYYDITTVTELDPTNVAWILATYKMAEVVDPDEWEKYAAGATDVDFYFESQFGDQRAEFSARATLFQEEMPDLDGHIIDRFIYHNTEWRYELGQMPDGRPRRCRSCGCTDEDCSKCIEKTGSPCSWSDMTLCSACNINGRPAIYFSLYEMPGGLRYSPSGTGVSHFPKEDENGI